MVFSVNFIKRFALFSITASIIHFIGEAVFMYLYGQTFIQTLIDFIAVSLLIFGSITTLKTPSSRGILCGAWGFTFCLNLRAWAWRFESDTRDHLNENIDVVGNILAIILVISFVAFVIAVLMNYPEKNHFEK